MCGDRGRRHRGQGRRQDERDRAGRTHARVSSPGCAMFRGARHARVSDLMRDARLTQRTFTSPGPWPLSCNDASHVVPCCDHHVPRPLLTSHHITSHHIILSPPLVVLGVEVGLAFVRRAAVAQPDAQAGHLPVVIIWYACDARGFPLRPVFACVLVLCPRLSLSCPPLVFASSMLRPVSPVVCLFRCTASFPFW